MRPSSDYFKVASDAHGLKLEQNCVITTVESQQS